MDFNLENIGRELRSRRLSAGVTQADLARRANISRATVNALENNAVKEIGVQRLSRLFGVLDNISPQVIIPKSKLLGLSCPYDWSNPNISDTPLIRSVLERGIFEDIVVVCTHYGLDAVTTIAEDVKLKSVFLKSSLDRMLANITEAFKHAA